MEMVISATHSGKIEAVFVIEGVCIDIHADHSDICIGFGKQSGFNCENRAPIGFLSVFILRHDIYICAEDLVNCPRKVICLAGSMRGE
jgi:hypothetical protein